MAEVTELVTRFGFQGSTQPLQNYNVSLGKSIGLLGGMTAALGLAAGAMRKFTTDTLAGVDSLIDMGTETQNSVQEIRELGFMAQQSGGSVQAMEGTISSLSSNIRDAALNGSEDFARLGISIRDNNGQLKDSVQIFEEARDRLSRMNLQTAERQNLAEAIGIDPSLIRLLEMGNEQYAALRENARQYGVITEDNKETILAYNNAQTEMTFAMQSLKTLVAVGMAPTMQRLSGIVAELIANNKDWVINGLQAAAKWVGAFLQMLNRLLPVIGLVLAGFVAWKAVLVGMAVWAAPALAIPALITAGIVALVLIIDDLIVAFKGGESAIASFFQEFFGWDIQPILRGIVDAVVRTGESITSLITGFLSFFFELSKGFGQLMSGDFDAGLATLEKAFHDWNETIRQAMMNMFGGVFDWVSKQIQKIMPGWLKDWITTGEAPGSDAPVQVGPGSPSIQPGFVTDRGGSGGGDTRIEINAPITVQGSGDAEGTGRATGRAIQRQLRDVNQHLRGGN